jgi:hypothetical protein
VADQGLALWATNQDFAFGLFIGTLQGLGLEIQESKLSDEEVSEEISPFSILDPKKNTLFRLTISEISFEMIEKEEKKEEEE